MYLSKNSRYVLLKSQWFSSNLVERSFKISFRKSKTKWPEEDSTKPPLRLNIPRDARISSTQNFRYTKRQRTKAAKFLDPGVDTYLGSKDIATDGHYLNRYDTTLEDNQESSEHLDQSNFGVTSNSLEFSKPKNRENEFQNSERKFKLKKNRSYDGVNTRSNESGTKDKNGIVTIQIEYDKMSQGNSKQIKELSRKVSKNAATDDTITAIAEAVVKELKHRDGDNKFPKIPQQEEAFLVIVNVSDKEAQQAHVPHIEHEVQLGSAGFSGGNVEYRTDHRYHTYQSPTTPTTDDAENDTTTSTEYHSYDVPRSEGSQVRDLEFKGKPKFRSEPETRRESDKKELSDTKNGSKNVNFYPSKILPFPKSVKPVNVVNAENAKGYGGDTYSDAQRLRNMKIARQNRNILIENEKTRRGEHIMFDVSQERERRKRFFDKSIQTVRGEDFSTIKKYNPDTDLTKRRLKKDPGFRRGFSNMKRFLSRQLFGTRNYQVKWAPRRYMSLRSKIQYEKDLERRMNDSRQILKLETTSILNGSRLKQFSTQKKHTDELPEQLEHSQKHSLFSHSHGNSGEAQSQIKTRTTRNYHNSCDFCNTSSDNIHSSLTFMKNLDGSAGSSDGKLKDVPVSKCDEERVLLKSEEKNVGKTDESVAAKCVENRGRTDNKTEVVEKTSPGETQLIKYEPPKQAQLACMEEKCELDVTDIVQLSNHSGASINKPPYSAAYPKNKGFEIQEKWRKRKIAEFINSANESHVLSEMCLNTEKTTNINAPVSIAQMEQSIGESLLNSKRDAIMNVVKNTAELSTPKMSDNIVNLANESLAESKGSSSLDSLSMMKRVKEIVDLDLKNAEKIFVPSVSNNAETNCTAEALECSTSFPNSPENDSQAAVESSTQIQEDFQRPQNFNPASLVSVIIYDDTINRFYVQNEELEYARNASSREMEALVTYEPSAWNGNNSLLEIINTDKTDLKDGFSLLIEEPQASVIGNYDCTLHHGDSMITFDEQTSTWAWDTSFARNAETNYFEEENSGKESTLGYDLKADKTEKMDENLESSKSVAIVESAKAPTIEKSDIEIKAEKDTTEVDASGKKCKEGVGVVEKKCNEPDTEEIRKKDSDLYDELLEMTSPKKQEEPINTNKRVDGTEKVPPEHYVSNNIVEMSKNNSGDKAKKARSNKIETVKLNMISPTSRPPSKVTEINLNKKTDDGKGPTEKMTVDAAGTREVAEINSPNGAFYNKFEKYKTPFSDPEYEEKPMKINSDLESNPNLKKLDSWNKTLVLPELNKSSDSVESWVKDETDQMATLLLKVLQEAAEGNTRRRIAARTSKGNPYEAIRKKQENPSFLMRSKRKEFPKKRGSIIQSRALRKELTDGRIFKDKNAVDSKTRLAILEDEPQVEYVSSSPHIQREFLRRRLAAFTKLSENTFDDIPGPDFLKKISAMWTFFPKIGCQTTIFLLMRVFQMAKASLSVFSTEIDKFQSDPFGKLFTKYGPIVKLEGPLTGNVVFVSKPEDITSTFLQAQASPAQSIFDSVENCRNRDRQRNFPNGITDSCNGIDWDIVRTSTIDVTSKGCLQYFNLMRSADSLLINKIDESRNKQNQVPDDFISEIQRWSLEGLCSILFDKSLGFLERKNSQVEWVSESERLMRNILEMTDGLCHCESYFQVWRFFNTPAMSTLNHAYQSIDMIVSKYVYQAEINLRKRRKAFTNNKQNANKNLSFIESALLNDRMTPEEITANLVDILLIGANTSTIALSFLLYNLAQNRRVQNQLFKEVKELLPQKTSQLSYHQLHSLKYLQACLRESMRLHVPIPILLRVLPNDIALGNYRIPQGTHLVLDLQMACMKEQNFDEPERFKPERWLEQDIVHPFSSIPFCSGPRGTFVKRLSEIQLWTCIAKIVRNFEIEYHFGDIKGTGNVLSYPNKPLKLTFIERSE
ncbi:UNVERIFIED_CONTAM: hypothetical protein PYX00_009206 [Menopon gallinae]|uniref:Cytochrome P450 n=1 Tax=Menopon gallinae TaxID=328185 RepID=A0AAW2HAP7_9NEOP